MSAHIGFVRLWAREAASEAAGAPGRRRIGFVLLLRDARRRVCRVRGRWEGRRACALKIAPVQQEARWGMAVVDQSCGDDRAGDREAVGFADAGSARLADSRFRARLANVGGWAFPGNYADF